MRQRLVCFNLRQKHVILLNPCYPKLIALSEVATKSWKGRGRCRLVCVMSYLLRQPSWKRRRSARHLSANADGVVHGSVWVARWPLIG